MNIALADDFKLSETYLLSSQTINRKSSISCKNRSGKYGFQPRLIFVRLVIGKTYVYWTILIIKIVCKNFVAVTDLVSLNFALFLSCFNINFPTLKASFPARNRFRFHNFNNLHDSNSNSKNWEILSFGLKKINYFWKCQCSFFKVFNFWIVNYWKYETETGF